MTGGADAQWTTVSLSVEDHVALVMMQRAQKRNAENVQLIEERHEALQAADADPEVRVIVLGGEGKSFSAGHDLGELREPEIAEARSTGRGLLAFERKHYFERSLAIRDLKKPVLAMVQGACIAGGLMTAAMCDLIVSADDAWFADPTLGMSMSAGGQMAAPGEKADGEVVGTPGVEVMHYPWVLGPRRAKEFLFTGEAMTADDALRCGLVSRVVPADRLREETLALAAKIATKDPAAVAMAKAGINHTLQLMGQQAAFEYGFLLHLTSHGLDAQMPRR